jgi:hypothetical protein
MRHYTSAQTASTCGTGTGARGEQLESLCCRNGACCLLQTTIIILLASDDCINDSVTRILFTFVWWDRWSSRCERPEIEASLGSRCLEQRSFLHFTDLFPFANYLPLYNSNISQSCKCTLVDYDHSLLALTDIITTVEVACVMSHMREN